jgi:hypothetical protein
MEAANTSKTSVSFHQTTRHNVPEDSHLHTRRRENLKPYKRKMDETKEINFVSSRSTL